MTDIYTDRDHVDVRMDYEDALYLLTHLTDTLEHYGTRPTVAHDRIGIRWTAAPQGGIDLTLAFCK